MLVPLDGGVHSSAYLGLAWPGLVVVLACASRFEQQGPHEHLWKLCVKLLAQFLFPLSHVFSFEQRIMNSDGRMMTFQPPRSSSTCSFRCYVNLERLQLPISALRKPCSCGAKRTISPPPPPSHICALIHRHSFLALSVRFYCR